MSTDNILFRVVEYLLDEVRDLKAEVTFYREAGNDRQRLIDRNEISQRNAGGLGGFNNLDGEPLTPAQVVEKLKSFPTGKL